LAVKVLTEDQWKSLSTKRMTARDRELNEYVETIKSGKIVQITPEGNATVRGLKASLTRRANQMGVKVEYRDMDKGFAARKK
jgi:hypothetical protein